jgi:hypothetical protein
MPTSSNDTSLKSAWRRVKLSPKCCQRWLTSYDDFVSDVGNPPECAGVLRLVHFDTLNELGPGNALWMDNGHATSHVAFEKHRQLMAEINQAIPPLLRKDKYYGGAQKNTKARLTGAREERLKDFREEVSEMRARRAKPRPVVVINPLDLKTVHKGRLITIRERVIESKVDLNTFLDAYEEQGTADGAFKAIQDNENRAHQEAWDRRQAAEQEAIAQRNERFRAASEQIEAERLAVYDKENPRWMALKIVPAVFDGKSFENSPFEAVNEEYASADRVLTMLKEGAHKSLVKVIPHEGTPYACFGVVSDGKTTFAYAEDYIVAIRYPHGYRLKVISGADFKTFVVDH